MGEAKCLSIHMRCIAYYRYLCNMNKNCAVYWGTQQIDNLYAYYVILNTQSNMKIHVNNIVKPFRALQKSDHVSSIIYKLTFTQ